MLPGSPENEEVVKAAAEWLEQELARMSRERLLPDEKILEKVARCEAHLSASFTMPSASLRLARPGAQVL
jgi:hypothetical protein